MLASANMHKRSKTFSLESGSRQRPASDVTDGDQCFKFLSVLWHCWLGDRNDVRSIKEPVLFNPEGSLPEWVKEEKLLKQPANPGSPGK